MCVRLGKGGEDWGIEVLLLLSFSFLLVLVTPTIANCPIGYLGSILGGCVELIAIT